MKKWLRFNHYADSILGIFLSLYLFIIPAGIILLVIFNSKFTTGEILPVIFYWHKALSKDIESWAQERVSDQNSIVVNPNDISGTEWPIFSSVFYLWTTESLQNEWEENPSSFPEAPADYAQGAIESTTALVVDPNHAYWVKKYWGEDYLHQENIFYRMLLISGVTSYQKLLGLDTYEDILVDQVESLSQELDQSPYGLLDDYPGECYPIDILPAIAAIQRVDMILNTDHSAFVERAKRGFEEDRLDPRTGLSSYGCDSTNGQGIGSAKGVGISYMLIWMPELWPDKAEEWYQNYQKYYWQESQWVSGVREYPKDYGFPDWFFFDVDAGPIVSGYGTAASAFGIGASRANSRLDRAYLLSTQAVVLAWPLPDGTLLLPRLLSNLSDAPYTGEAALLFALTRNPQVDDWTFGEVRIPFVVYLILFGYIFVGLYIVSRNILRLFKIEKILGGKNPIPYLKSQLIIWGVLGVMGTYQILLGEVIGGIVLIVLSRLLPYEFKGYDKEQLGF